MIEECMTNQFQIDITQISEEYPSCGVEAPTAILRDINSTEAGDSDTIPLSIKTDQETSLTGSSI
jgi:hypothetical protein